MNKRPTLAKLAALADQLESDEEQPRSELRRRDRKIGRELEHLRDHRLAQLAAWLERVRRSERDDVGKRAARALGIATVGLVFFGLASGWLAAAAVFYYDGSRPVNVIHVLALFVGFQLLLLLLLAIVLLPEGGRERIPGMASVQEALGMLSPGRLLRFFSRFLPESYRHATASLFGRSSAHHLLFGHVEKWVVVRSGQAFGVAFNLGALAGCLYLVVFTDLAFGWSTTLNVDAQHLQGITDALAWPWGPFVPQAKPSLELIEATRYFRWNPGVLSGGGSAGAGMMGGWWPFLILCLLLYGLMPRMLLLIVSQFRLNAALRRTMLHLPGVGPLFDRLNSQLVETQAVEPESGAVTASARIDRQRGRGELQGKAVSVIDWSDTGLRQEALLGWLDTTWGGSLVSLYPAGGGRTLEQDRQVLSSVTSDNSGAVLLLVKGWEPPMAEFRDFLEELRRAAGRNRPLGVVPLGVGSMAELLSPAPEQQEVWAAAVEHLGDPWTEIVPLEQAGGA